MTEPPVHLERLLTLRSLSHFSSDGLAVQSLSERRTSGRDDFLRKMANCTWSRPSSSLDTGSIGHVLAPIFRKERMDSLLKF
jgi:hypothetical protein